jgi:hypothetical protein|tara:strand:- start:434 stop:667 length:234 start_codon:yes stop_codon:yes gene_type:complete
MKYNALDAEKIAAFKTWSDKRKIDELLMLDANLYCNIGSDSTIGEVRSVYKKSRTIYTAIKSVDKEMGSLFLRAMDT